MGLLQLSSSNDISREFTYLYEHIASLAIGYEQQVEWGWFKPTWKGGAYAEILNENIEGMNASAQSTGASVANINMLKDGEVDLAIVQNDITYYAVNGTEMFKDNKVDNIKGIAALYPETCQFVTLDSSGIKKISDGEGGQEAEGRHGAFQGFRIGEERRHAEQRRRIRHHHAEIIQKGKREKA